MIFFRYSLLILALFSCQREVHDSFIVNVSSNTNQKSFNSLLEIASDISFLPLETRKDILIGKQPQVKFNDSIILINDCFGTHKLYLFNRANGSFIRTVGQRGKGPGELLYFHDIICNNGQITIGDFGTGKIVKYNTYGDFIDEVKLKKPYPGYFEIADSNNYWFYYDAGRPNCKYALTKVNSSFSKEKGILINDKKKFAAEINPFSRIGDRTFFHSPFNNHMYALENSKFTEKIYLEGLNDFKRTKNLDESINRMIKEGFYSVNKYLENKEILYISWTFQKGDLAILTHYVYLKKDKKEHRFSFSSERMTNSTSYVECAIDLTENNELVFFVDAVCAHEIFHFDTSSPLDNPVIIKIKI